MYLRLCSGESRSGAVSGAFSSPMRDSDRVARARVGQWERVGQDELFTTPQVFADDWTWRKRAKVIQGWHSWMDGGAIHWDWGPFTGKGVGFEEKRWWVQLWVYWLRMLCDILLTGSIAWPVVHIRGPGGRLNSWDTRSVVLYCCLSCSILLFLLLIYGKHICNSQELETCVILLTNVTSVNLRKKEWWCII